MQPVQHEPRAAENEQPTQDASSVVQAQIIECLNRFYAMETGMWGDQVSALIVRTILQGEMQGRLYDLSPLADTLDLPVATVHRRVASLVEAGHIRRLSRRRSVALEATENTRVAFDRSFEDMIATLRRLYYRAGLD